MPIFAPVLTGPITFTDSAGPIIDKLYEIVTDLYESSGAQALIGCHNSSQTRGWKIDWIPSPNANIQAGGIDIGLRIPSIEWAPCGCYEVLDWPVLSLGLGSAAIVARKLRKKASRKISLYIKDQFGSPMNVLRDNWYKYRNWGLNDWDRFVKLPPVPSGHKRLYRMNRSVSVVASDSNGWGTGRWFTDNQEYAIRHNKYTKGNGYITYIDVPIDIANDAHMGNENGKWIKRLKESGEQMNGGQGADPSKLTDNPARFVGSKSIAPYEYFLDSAYANQATKVSQFSNLPDIKELDDAWKPIQKLFESYDAEQFLDNINYRNNFINDWNNKTNALKVQLNKYFDNSDFVFDWLFNGNDFIVPIEANPNGTFYRPSKAGLENLLSEDSEIMKTVAKALGLFAFINELLTVTDVVRDKNCSYIGRNSTYGLTAKDKEIIKELRDGAIAKNKTTWAELDPETCECSQCPPDWNLCDNSSITNFYSTYGNTCYPPCCGGQEWKPITLIETCKCACPDGQVFMPCECSECEEGSGTPILDIITQTQNTKGICVETNPDPTKLEWNPKSCKWECSNTMLIKPPHLWGGFLRVPIEPPCGSNQVRKPNTCECSGSYSIENCDKQNFLNSFNIITIKQIQLF